MPPSLAVVDRSDTTVNPGLLRSPPTRRTGVLSSYGDKVKIR